MARPKMTLQASGVNGGVAYSFPHNPAECPKIHPRRRTGKMSTYRSEASFNWGFISEGESVRGVIATLRWPYMAVAFWTMLLNFSRATATVSWVPGDDYTHANSKTYSVIVMTPDGRDMDVNTSYKKDVSLEIKITGIV